MHPEECPEHAGCATYSTSQACRTCRPILKKFIIEALEYLPKFEVVAFTGSSGAAFGYWLADELGIETAHILKPSEQTHGASIGRGAVGAPKTWLFIDDFTESGATYQRVRGAMGSEPVGALFYQPFYQPSAGVRYMPNMPSNGVFRSWDNTPELFP